VAEWVGDLPIALDLLNRSLHLNAISAEDLLRRVKPSPALPGAAGELDRLREALRGQVPRDAVHGVTEAFSISFHRLDHASQNTALILAQLAPTPIPDALMDALPEGWKSRAALSSRHFVTGGGDRSFGVMHPLMADFLRSVAKEPKSGWFQTALRALTRVVASDRRSVATGSGSEWFLAACQALSRVMPIDRCRDPDQWPLVTLCRPHAEVLFARGRTLDATVAPSSEIGFLAALLATEQFDYAGARRLYEQVVEVRTRVLGEENQDTLVAMNNLAETLAKLGDGEGQRRIHERVLEVKTRLLGEAHPSTLMTTSNLALTLCLMKEVAEGRRLMERAVQTCTRELGASHLTTLETMSDLAFMLGPHADNAEDQAEVRRLQEQVLEGRTKLLGEAHPDTLEALDNLAWTLQSQRDIAGWRRLRELALDATAGLLGESDPATLKAMNELVWTLEVQGDDAGASRIRERAFEASIRALREERTDALQQMDRLANSLRDPALALQLRERMVEVSARVLGKNAPATLRATRELAADLVGRDPARARQLLEHVLEVSTELFGENHRDTFAAKLWLFQIGPESGNVRESGL
jgi:hypothetical protein